MYPLLRIENLAVEFDTGSGLHRALHEISFSVNAGEIVALVGESGSGKSVTSLSVLQLLPGTTTRYPNGKILFSPGGLETVDLLKVNEPTLQSLRGSQIAMIFQEPMSSLNPVMKCGQQVQEAIQLHKNISDAVAKQEVLEWFQKVKLPNPEEVFEKYPYQLSGGQKQRVMIAMAMSGEPALLICDEPTTALDVTVQKTILELLKELQQITAMGIIFITHDLGVVAEVADRVVVMYRGNIVEQNNIQNLFNNPQHPYTKGLLACRPALHTKGNRLPVVADFIGEKSSQPQVTSIPPETKKHNPEPILDVKNLTVDFVTRRNWLGKPVTKFRAVDRVSFQVMSGETLGLVGESGCGKTTLGRTLMQLVEPSEGTILFKGRDLSQFSKDEIKKLRQSIQIVFQDPFSSLNPRIPIGEAIAEPLKVHYGNLTAQQRKEKVIYLLEKTGLQSDHYNRYPHEFSGGQRQRIVIARALGLQPEFLVCDESVSALDVSVQAQVLNLLNDLKAEFGFTILFISHDLSVVRYFSDRIIVMNKGRIEESGPADQVYLHPQTEYTRKLIAAIPGLPQSR